MGLSWVQRKNPLPKIKSLLACHNFGQFFHSRQKLLSSISSPCISLHTKTIETVKGHLNQTTKNVCSTKAKTVPLETWHTSQLHGKKVWDVYTQTYMVCKTMLSDQTDQLPTQSQWGNKYIMTMMEIDSKAILVEPMKSRRNAEMIHTYNVLLLWLKWAGFPRSTSLTTKYQITWQTTSATHANSAWN